MNNIPAVLYSPYFDLPFFRDLADVFGTAVLAAILLFAFIRYLRLRRLEAFRAGAPVRLLEFPLALFGPLLMFAGLYYGLNNLQDLHSILEGKQAWINYKLCQWLLFGVVTLQQLFVIERLRFNWNAGSLRLSKIAMVALPVAFISSIGALKKIFFGYIDHVFDDITLIVSMGAVFGIVFCLVYLMTADRRVAPAPDPFPKSGTTGSAGHSYPEQLLAGARTPYKGAEPGPMLMPVLMTGAIAGSPAALAQQQWWMMPAANEAVAPGGAPQSRTTDSIEMALQEIDQLIREEDVTETRHDAAAPPVPEQDDDQSLSILHQVNQEKMLFDKGLPFNLPMLVHGLIILDKSADLHAQAGGDTLLHLAVKAGDGRLIRELLENGADPDGVNWNGVSARDLAEDASIQALLGVASSST